MSISSSSKVELFLNAIEAKTNFFVRHIIFSLSILGIVAIILRIYFLPNIPLTQDAIAYFQYANDVIVLHNLPSSFSYLEIGWPTFLSLFFSVFHFNNFMDYMLLQRLITISISVSTIVPIYLLSNRIFESRSYSLVCAALFVFEPHIIRNSLQGLSEPLFIFLGVTTLFLLLYPNKKIVYASFGTVALFTIVRSQGIILFIIISLLFFVLYRKEHKVVLSYLLGITVFFSILLPVMMLRTEVDGSNVLTGHINGAISNVVLNQNTRNENLFDVVIKGTEIFAIRLAQSMIPYFVLFVPFGSLLIFQNRNSNNIAIMLTIGISFIFSIYIFWASSDIRHIFWLYPLFAILAVFTIKKIADNINNHNTFLILLICGVILLSWFFLYANDVNIEHEKEALKLAYYLAENTKVINHYLPESGYLAIPPLASINNFPVLHSSIPSTVPRALEVNEDSMEKFIKKGRIEGLTHIVTDGNPKRSLFLQEAFYDEKKYQYLIKVFDSREHGYRYYVKVYKIDYDKFNSITNNNAQ